MNKKTKMPVMALMMILLCLLITACEKEPEHIEPTGFSIDANKVLIAEKTGFIEVPITIKPSDTYPIELSFNSSNNKVATATLGAIDKNGNVQTAAKLQKKKDELYKNDKEASEQIIVPTNTAIIKAEGFGECKIIGKLGGFTDSLKVTVANKQVALTFDDGIAPPSFKLLEGLKDEDVKVTFFIVGEMTKKSNHFDGLKQAVSDGHEIGNHTYSHNASASTLKKELAKTDKLIIKAGGKKTTLMRPPGGVINKGTKKCGKAIIMWSLDTLDWKYKNPNKVCDKIVDNVKNGDIVLIHDLHKTSVKGSLQAIKKLKKKGFYLVTVTELLENPKANKKYTDGNNKPETQIIN